MSTDPYPEVTVDESGIVPPQGARPSEWPKKLRTLTAAELDRLTIDNSGRFYWDGKLVNYDTGTKQITDKTSESLSDSMDILDRASRDLGGRKSPATIEGQLAEPAGSSDEPGAVNLDVVRAQGAAAVAEALLAPPPPPALRTASDHTRLTLSRGQTAGAIIVVLAIVIGAIGMATYGYVAYRDWGCKTGASESGCPVKIAPPPRADIPA
jgi:hypothetical protein